MYKIFKDKNKSTKSRKGIFKLGQLCENTFTSFFKPGSLEPFVCKYMYMCRYKHSPLRTFIVPNIFPTVTLFINYLKNVER